MTGLIGTNTNSCSSASISSWACSISVIFEIACRGSFCIETVADLSPEMYPESRLVSCLMPAGLAGKS